MVYERIRELRQDKGLKQIQLSSLLNIAQRTYSRYETGDRTIPPEILCEIANFYHTSVDYLLERTDEMQPYPLPKRRR